MNLVLGHLSYVEENHPHPIPIPLKTPLHVQKELRKILESLDDDLADLTPRRFLRHPALKVYLASHFPLVQNPTLCDLHISLAIALMSNITLTA